MTDRAQFEAMLEALINDDQTQAKEIFHNIVVGKSREIYEELLAEDFSQDAGNPYKKEDMEPEMEEDDEMSPMEEESEEDDSDDSEDDADDSEDDADDSEDDGEENPFGDEEGGEGDEDLEDRVMDLEDALEDLKAEFEQLLAGEEHEEENEPGIHGDDMGGMGDADMGMDTEVDELSGLMEYVDKVAAPKHGDNGTNNKSLIDNMANNMGGTTKNIAQNHVEVSGDAGVKAGGTQGGLANPKAGKFGDKNVNVPGSKNATTLKPVKGGGIDRQAGFTNPGQQVGATDSSGKGESNTQSVLRARK
jgi:hypothetical protein